MQISTKHTTAILVFAQSSKEESRRKGIVGGTLLFDSLTKRTLEVVRKTKLPYFHLTEAEQIGTTFSERFTNAIQSVFDQGFENIVTVGNDTPQLRSSNIVSAVTKLNERKSVIGPSADGGFYLMGLHKSNFNPTTFKELPWQTADLYRALTDVLMLSGSRIFRLSTYFDLDDFSDLRLFSNRFGHYSKKLLKLISALLTGTKESHFHFTRLFDSLLSFTFFNKGSPHIGA